MLDPTDTHYHRISYRRPFMKKTFMTKNRYDSPNAELTWLIQGNYVGMPVYAWTRVDAATMVMAVHDTLPDVSST